MVVLKAKDLKAEEIPWGIHRIIMKSENVLIKITEMPPGKGHERHKHDENEVIVAHPDYLHRVVGEETRVIGITENDPLGMGPATTTFTQLFGGEAYMAIKFREILNHPAVIRYKPKIIVGGAGAWQLEDDEVRRGLGIDCVVVGEGEKVVGPLFEKAVNGEPLPELVYGDVVPEEDMPIIRNPTIHGLIEIARGCGRGCAFCVPTLLKLRSRPISHILKEVEVNVRAGKNPILHAEDVLRYGTKKIEPDEEKVIKLFKAIRNHPAVEHIGISHFALASVACAPKLVEEITPLMGVGETVEWIGAQTGIETGSPEMIKMHMAGKCKPFKPEEWPDVVVRAYEILKDNNWLPCSTIIIGLPGETEKDVSLTIDLVERLWSFRGLIVPLFFVAIGRLRKKSKSLKLEDLTIRRSELLLKCWEYNLKWAKILLNDYLRTWIKNRIVRASMRKILEYGIKYGSEAIKKCREDYGYNLLAFREDVVRGRVSITPRSVAIIRKIIEVIRKH